MVVGAVGFSGMAISMTQAKRATQSGAADQVDEEIAPYFQRAGPQTDLVRCDWDSPGRWKNCCRLRASRQ